MLNVISNLPAPAGSGMRVLLGYAAIALSLILFLALASFNPADSSLFVSSVQNPVSNITGFLGVQLTAPIVLLYGKYSGILLAFGLFTMGINILVGSKLGRLLIKLTLFFISAICLSIILALSIPNASFTEAGLFGLGIAQSISAIIPPVALIIIFSILLLMSLVSTMKLFQIITTGLAKIIGVIVLAPFELFGLIIHRERQDNPGKPEENPAFIFKDSYDKPRDEGDILPERRPEPQFLNPEFAYEGAHNPQPFQPANTASASSPLWLSTDTGKNQALNEIRSFYDREMDDRPKSVPNEETITESKPEEIINPVISVIKDEPEQDLETIPQEELEESPFQPEESELPEGIEEVEIVGEADYSEQTLSRMKTLDVTDLPEEKKEPFMDEEDEEIKENYEPSEFLFPETSNLEKSFDDFSKAEETQETDRVSSIIENTFASFKIEIKVSGYSRGPAITRYEIIPPSGLKIKNIVSLTDDLALNLGTRNIRIVAPIGNRSIVGVEVPNKFRRNVVLRDIIESDEYKKTRAKLPLVLGKDIAGNIVIEDLTEMPHLLIAGTTGSGKSVYVNSLIGGIVFKRTAEEVKFIFIDPKMVELELYNGIPHLLAPVITSPEEAVAVLEWASREMDKRYKILSDIGVRNIVDYNKEAKKIKSKKAKTESGLEVFPYIVIVIDEFANLMLRMPKETEKVISRIAAMARAVGIHLVVATQRPSVDVVTGIIKANFPSRIAFRVSSQTDARTIMDKAGAEKLLGKGDMLFMTPNFTDMIRIQTPFVSNTDVETLVRELKRNGTADYVIDVDELMSSHSSFRGDDSMSVDYKQDPIFIESLKAAVENGDVSASYLQRRFRIGYNRASRIIEGMEQMKILGPSTGTSKPREVLINQEDLVHFLD